MRQKWRFKPSPPLRRNVERIDEGGEQAEIADLHFDIVETGGAQRFHRQRQNFGFGGGAILVSQKFDARLIELGRSLGLRRLVTEDEAVIAEPRGKLPARLQ